MSRHSPAILRFESLLDRLSGLCILLASCALVVLVATFGWLVFGRYVLNATPTWVEQLALLLVCYIAYLGAAAGIHEQTHLGVTFLRDSLPPRLREILLFLTDVLLAAFGAVMFIASLELFQFGWDTLLPMLNIPESIRTASALACGGLMLVFAGSRAVLRVIYAIGGDLYSAVKEEV